jgi:hypothetical protein
MILIRSVETLAEGINTHIFKVAHPRPDAWPVEVTKPRMLVITP